MCDLVKIKPLVWSEVCAPATPSFHDKEARSASALGEYTIEWKSWKGEDDGVVVYLNGDFVCVEYSLADAKSSAQSHHDGVIHSALEDTEAAAELTRLRSEKEELAEVLRLLPLDWIRLGIFEEEAADPIEITLAITGTSLRATITVGDLRRMALLSRVSGGGK